MESAVLCVAHFSQLSSGRQVGCANETSTNLPFACGSQATSPALSATSGKITTGARTGRPFGVGGLHASIVPSSERTRGDTRSTCVGPRRQLRQVPYCSFRAVMPHELYVAINQFCAAVIPGDAVRRGPRESNSACARRGSCELSLPIAQMRRTTGFSTTKPDGCGNCAFALMVTRVASRAVAVRTRRTVQLRLMIRRVGI